MKYFSLKAYDGTIVRVEEGKVEEFKKSQENIKKLLESGKSIEQIKKIMKENNK